MDAVDGPRQVVCDPPSGSTFPAGVTTVTCSASDASGNVARASFTITIRDTSPPVISGLPANQTVSNAPASGAVMNWIAPTASDAVDGSVAVSCTPRPAACSRRV